VYPVDVRLIWPVAKRGRPRRRYIPDILSMPAEDMLADAKWQMVSWRTGTKGKLKACFAAVRIRTADGPPQRIKDKGQQHLPGDEAWLIGELRASGEKKYYLSNRATREKGINGPPPRPLRNEPACNCSYEFQTAAPSRSLPIGAGWQPSSPASLLRWLPAHACLRTPRHCPNAVLDGVFNG
jgi:hypothetical protein